MTINVIAGCRSCRGDVETVLSLGNHPLANALLGADQLDQPEARFPLTLAFCAHCGLGQIRETIPPQELFAEYVYFSSYSDGMIAHAKESTDELVKLGNLGPDSLVVEVASNDGYQLQFFRDRGVPVLGIEPAANIAAVAEASGIPSLAEFFDADLAEQLVTDGHRADLILGYNVLAHVPDPNSLVVGISRLLSDEGIAVIEVPDAARMLELGAFDTIYHEHMSYFSLTALTHLFNRHGLEIFDVRELSIHGGSLRLYVSGQGRREVAESVPRILQRDADAGLVDGRAWRGFGERVARLKDDLVSTLEELRRAGKSIGAYGAAAKGSTLLNYFGIDASSIEFVADRSPHKQGRFMPGVHIPIRDEHSVLAAQPDVCLILAWNFADEIIAQQSEYRAAGGRFLIPLPEPRFIS